MLVQQTLFIASVIGIADVGPNREAFIVLTMIALHYGLLMGRLMSITSHQLCKRVRRTMPQTVGGWGSSCLCHRFLSRFWKRLTIATSFSIVAFWPTPIGTQR